MTERIDPGGTIGILGGGQLGRLLALAAAKLGYHTHVFCSETGCPASFVATHNTCASYDDHNALDAFAGQIDVATFEFENVPAQTVARIADAVPVRPSWKALEIAQDRAKEKAFFADIGAATAPWRPVHSLDELAAALRAVDTPAILKTARLGYDGKGQILIENATDAASAWSQLTNDQTLDSSAAPFAVLEGFVKFTSEISVIAARGLDGQTQCFEPVENVHKNHVLHTTTAPANISSATAKTAVGIAERAAEALNLVGIVAVEMFVTSYGGVLVNEMAPRPHNSGHWTLDACQTDQFTQLIRAICGLPLAEPLRHSNAVMTNLLGEGINNVDEYYADPACHVYVYGKSDARPGRKMGHVTRLSARTNT
ncbi:MAG: 5-(carboxyamino)imidazole ribonucleotide synthase [Rhodospirillaceae bacterium]|nr:5-(carboxyamino)imidazole ribonucleotide synthase [Rhodospirillaceae bacterium]MBT6089839.1 5-(carboxyamino)imidazole ribonucleotide synthase [Rhodospirillaceae bacterium]